MSNIEETLETFDNLTPSQRSRLNFREEVMDTLLNFLQAFVQQSIETNNLEAKLDEDLYNALNDPDPEHQLTNFEKIKLKEVISREKTDSKGSLVRALIDGTKNIEANKKKIEEESESKKIGKEMTQKNIDEALSAIKFLTKLQKDMEKTELTPEELEKNK